jgi:hypothetical protein
MLQKSDFQEKKMTLRACPELALHHCGAGLVEETASVSPVAELNLAAKG